MRALFCAALVFGAASATASAAERTVKGSAQLKAAGFERRYDVEILVVTTPADAKTASVKLSHKGFVCTFTADRKGEELIIPPRQTCAIDFVDNGTRVVLTGEVTQGVLGRDQLALAFSATGFVQGPPVKGLLGMEFKLPPLPVQGVGNFDGRTI